MMRTGNPSTRCQHVYQALFYGENITYPCDGLRYTNGSSDAKDLPEKIEQYPPLWYLQQRLVALNEAGFPNEIQDLRGNAVAFKPAPLDRKRSVSSLRMY